MCYLPSNKTIVDECADRAVSGVKTKTAEVNRYITIVLIVISSVLIGVSVNYIPELNAVNSSNLSLSSFKRPFLFVARLNLFQPQGSLAYS